MWLVGGIYRCGYREVGVVRMYRCGQWVLCKEVFRFSHITYPYSTCISSFLQQHPYFFAVECQECSGYAISYITNYVY